MLIRIGYELLFDIPTAPVPMILMLYTHPEHAHILQQPEKINLEPGLPLKDFIDSFGNRAALIVAPRGKLRITYSNIAFDSGLPEPAIDNTLVHPVEDLPPDVLPFLLPSRYCEVDRMTNLAWQLFGHTPATWQRVKSIVEWAHHHITFGYPFASPTKTAWDVFHDKQGVCRDYMHLAITLLRAMNIPARYATGYLGDIGVPINPAPMDFSAYLEVYLSGKWQALDARHNAQRIGRIKQAHGRDAADAALTTSFGPTTLEKFAVWTDEIKSDGLT